MVKPKKQNQTPMQKQFAGSYEGKRKEMFIMVAKELTGRAKHRELKGKDSALNWEKFNKYCEEFYADYSADELLEEILNTVYWLANEQAVIDLYFRYLRDAQEAANGTKSKKKPNEDNEDDEEFAL